MILHKFRNFYYKPPQAHINGALNVMATPYTTIEESTEFVYIDISQICAISEYQGKGTNLHIPGMGPISVREHISEVIALLEGRDPMPSKILFGKTNG